MFSKLTVFQTANAMATHAGARQALIAQNVANADTPGYRARDLPAFAQVVNPTSHFAGAMRSTRAGHASTDTPSDVARFKSFSENDLDPNKNGVSLEEEMMRAAEVKMTHERALAIYRSAMQIMRMSVSA